MRTGSRSSPRRPTDPSRSRCAATSRCRVPSRCPKEARSTSRWRSTSARCRSHRRHDSPGDSRSTARPRRTGSCRFDPRPSRIDDVDPRGGTAHGGARPARSAACRRDRALVGGGAGGEGPAAVAHDPGSVGGARLRDDARPNPGLPRHAALSRVRRGFRPQPRGAAAPVGDVVRPGWGWAITVAPWRCTRPPRGSWSGTQDAFRQPSTNSSPSTVSARTRRGPYWLRVDAEVAAVDTNVGRVLARRGRPTASPPRGAGFGGSPRSGRTGARVEPRRDGLRQSRLYGACPRLCHLSGACGRGLCLEAETRRRSRPGSWLGAGDDRTIPVRRFGPTGTRSARAGRVCRTDCASGPRPGRRIPGAGRTRPACRRRARQRGDPRAAARR